MSRVMDFVDVWCHYRIEYGISDCLQSSLRFFDQHCGTSLLKALPKYRSRQEALRHLAKSGKSYPDYLDGILLPQGFKVTTDRLEENLVLADGLADGGPILGLRLDEGAVAFQRDPDGLYVNTGGLKVVREWRI